MGVLERREREKALTRTRIMDAARVLFAREGYEAVSMRRIADAVEYSPAAIYVHFRDKEALLREICAADYEALTAAFRRAAGVADPLARIRDVGAAYVRFGLRHPNHYRLMFMTPIGEDAAGLPPTPEELARRGDPERDGYAFLGAAVSEALDRGLLRPELTDAQLVAQVLWAGVHGVVSLQIAMGGDPWIDWRPMRDRSGLMLDTLLRGIARGTRDGGPRR